MPTHEIYLNRNGTTSLRHLASGEVMHSSVGPEEEARLLYIEQSALEERLSLPGEQPLVLFDIGLGAGTNALAAIQCAIRASKNQALPTRRLHVLSFENDLSGLKLALEHHERFPFFAGLEPAAQELLTEGRHSSELFDWQLKEGHFMDHLAGCPAPELVFFDMYSPKVTPEHWTVPLFTRLYEHVSQNSEAELFTYSASTRVRAALLCAGFFVGYGQSTGAKIETTTAAIGLKNLKRPLDARWITRFQGSHVPLPHGWPEADRDRLFETVLSHAQFKS